MAKLTEKRMNELFRPFSKTDYETGPFLRVCVGSWKAYNECNKHALGACYKGRYFIDFLELDGAEELGDVLDTLGYTKLEKEELFVQDYESDFITLKNCDCEDPRSLADFIAEHKSEIEDDADKIKAIMESTGADYIEAMNSLDDYDFYRDMDGEDYERMTYEETTPAGTVPEWIERYIDFAAMARDDTYSGYLHEVNSGVLIYNR